MEEYKLTAETREGLLVLYGYLKGLNGKVLGPADSLFGKSIERMYVPSEVTKPLDDLLFPKAKTEENS